MYNIVYVLCVQFTACMCVLRIVDVQGCFVYGCRYIDKMLRINGARDMSYILLIMYTSIRGCFVDRNFCKLPFFCLEQIKSKLTRATLLF